APVTTAQTNPAAVAAPQPTIEDFESPSPSGVPTGFSASYAVEPGPPGANPTKGTLAKWAMVEEITPTSRHVLKLVESKNRGAVYNLCLRDAKSPADSSVSVRLRPD